MMNSVAPMVPYKPKARVAPKAPTPAAMLKKGPMAPVAKGYLARAKRNMMPKVSD